MTDYLTKFGKQVVENGYKIVPIRPRGSGESEKAGKAPGLLVPYQLLSGWQDLKWKTADVEHAVKTGNGGCGIGIQTKYNPAADIDCFEASVVEQIKAFVVKRLGATIERVGNAPKTLLLFRTDTPFGKVSSKGYVDRSDRPAKLEILGAGQQFVALAQHPVTGAPYIWTDGVSVADTWSDALPLMTREDALALCAEFDRLASIAGWTVTGEGARGNYNPDDPFISDKPKITDLNAAELRERLFASPNDDDYDTWLQTGMALFHQYEGSDEGLDLWLEWSDQSTKHEAAFCTNKWESGTFEIEDGREPITFAYVLRRAADAEKVQQEQRFDLAKQKIQGAKTKEDLFQATKFARSLDIDDFARKELAENIRHVFKDVGNGASLTTAEAVKLVRYAPTKMPEMPDWLEGYVFITADKAFYSTRTGRMLPVDVFDAVHGRLLLTPTDRLEGKSHPEHRPSEVALNRYEIQTVEDRRYAPDDRDTILMYNHVPYVNSYSDRGLPMVPETETAAGRAAVQRIVDHVRHLVANERDAAIMLSYLAYIVQTKRRVNWGLFLQGTQGDGKSFFNILMSAVLGADNVTVIGGHAMEEQYTGWSENALMVFVEEVRLDGENRYKVLNRVKTLITNPIISVRRMRRDSYMVPNKASYFMISNFKDALPVDEEDNRYFPIFSRWQTQEALNAFKQENPTYYRNLYAALNQAGAIRKWLLGYTLSPLFNADERAPVSSSKAEMVEHARDDTTEAVRAVIAAGTALDFSPTLVDNAKIAPAVFDEFPGAEGLGTRRLATIMQKAGYSSLGQVKVGGHGRRFWTLRPDLFRKTGADGVDYTNTDAVRRWLTDEL